MFIAHIPSGYIMSVSLLKRIRNIPVSTAVFVLVGMVGALSPDVDIVYFYLVDHRQTHHHKYITHWPLLWMALFALSLLGLRFSLKPKVPFPLIVLFLGCVLHVVLDSVAGDNWWLAPFVDQPFSIFTVPSIFIPWWINFIFHWSFALEIVICIWAIVLYRRGHGVS